MRAHDLHISTRFIKAFLRIIITLIVIIQSHASYGQVEELDSLKNLVNTTTGKSKVDALNALAFRQILIGYTVANKTIKQAIVLSEKEKYTKGLAEAYSFDGICKNLSGDKESGFLLLRKSKQLAHKIGDHAIEGYALLQIGNIHRGLGTFDSAKYWYDKSFQVLKDSLNPWQLSVLYRNLGRYYNLTSQPKSELAFLLRSLQIREKLQDKVLLTDVYVLLSQWYINQSNLALAKEYLNRAEKLNISETLTEIKKDINYQKTVILFKELRFNEALEALKEVKHYYLSTGNLLVYARLLLDLAELLEEIGSYDLSLQNCFESLKICEEKRSTIDGVRAKLLIGRNYMRIVQTAQAHEFTDHALKTAQDSNFKFYEGAAYNLKGLILQVETKYPAALVNFEKGFFIRKQIGDKPGMAASLNNIGEIYEEMGDLPKALDFQIQSEAMAVSVLSLKSMCWANLHMGRVYLKQKKFTQADFYLKKAEKTAIQIKSPLSLEYIYPARRELFIARNELNEALRYSMLYEQLKDSINYSSITNRILSLQSIHDLENKDKEIELLNKNKQVQKDQITIQSNKIQRQQFFIIASVLGLILVSVLAYTLYVYFKKMARHNREVQERNEEIQAQSEELSETNILLLTLNQNLSESKEEVQSQAEELTQANTLLTIVNAELAEKNEIMTVQSEELTKANTQFVYLNNELSIKQKELETQAEELKESYEIISELNESLEQKVDERTKEMQQAYKELDTFFYRSSHDFRRPLTTFMGLAEVAKITVKDKNALDLFIKVKETAVNLDRMLIKLQSISDVGTHQFIYREVSMRNIYENAVDTYREVIDQYSIRIIINVGFIKTFLTYPAFLKIIAENLVENAIQFRGRTNPYILLEALEKDQGVQLTIRDNGQGVEEEYEGRLFDMFFRGNEQSKGNGLGLYIVKKAIDKLKGTINLETKYSEGTTVRIWIPQKQS